MRRICEINENAMNTTVKESGLLKPYTMEEINARIDKAERDAAEGRYRDHDEIFAKFRQAVLEAV